MAGILLAPCWVRLGRLLYRLLVSPLVNYTALEQLYSTNVVKDTLYKIGHTDPRNKSEKQIQALPSSGLPLH